MMTRRLLALVLCLVHVETCFAQLYDMSKQLPSNGNEFFVGKEYGKPLIKVNLISGVQRPGVYHVPLGSDLAEVIAYAGGATDKADLRDITLTRQAEKPKKSIDINLTRELASPDPITRVADQDVIHIAVDRTVDKTMNWVGILSGIASIALAIAVIDNQNH